MPSIVLDIIKDSDEADIVLLSLEEIDFELDDCEQEIENWEAVTQHMENAPEVQQATAWQSLWAQQGRKRRLETTKKRIEEARENAEHRSYSYTMITMQQNMLAEDSATDPGSKTTMPTTDARVLMKELMNRFLEKDVVEKLSPAEYVALYRRLSAKLNPGVSRISFLSQRSGTR